MNFNKSITIGEYTISEDNNVFVIAEAGVNHNGDLAKAKELVDVAASSGADAVKFQTFKTENLILKSVEKALYQKNNTSVLESQYQMLKKLEITKEQNLKLISYCKKKYYLSFYSF